MICAKCLAPILPGEPSEEHGPFHTDCYRKWILSLYEELHGTRVKAAAVSK